MKVLILLLLFCLTLEAMKFNQFSSISISGSNNFYLSLDDFKSGDNVDIEVTCYFNSGLRFSIQYCQSNSYNDSDFNSCSFTSMSPRIINKKDPKITHYYTIKLNEDSKYLLFKFLGASTYYTIKNKLSKANESNIPN